LSKTLASPTLGGSLSGMPEYRPLWRAAGIHGGCGAVGANHKRNGRSSGASSMNSTAFSASTSVA
jgi:hypothetical protein